MHPLALAAALFAWAFLSFLAWAIVASAREAEQAVAALQLADGSEQSGTLQLVPPLEELNEDNDR